ncbi:MAG TPA: AAA family ATPase, partial [Hyalangium sp.]|nr:AAA family ATPase [Hyalangium sp.]
MSQEHAGQVITFYSYKGGVGRSMAVANVATLLAQRGKRVLVLDFDFEAPGLHRYFFNKPSGLNRRLESEAPRLGMIEFFCALRDQLQQRLPQGFPVRGDGQTLSGEQADAFLAETVRELVRSEEFGYGIRLLNPNVPAKDPKRVATLRFMPVGRTRDGNLDPGYVTQVHTFDWRDFYSKYKEVFPALAEEWGGRYDYVLIDSRTGLTDIGSICTQLLPEKLVLVFSPNQQSLHGALEVGRQAVKQRQASEDLRPLPLFPLISRVEDSEEIAKRDWIVKAQEQFQALFHEIYDLEECDLGEYFSLARIPHRSFYAYGERIAAEEQPTRETGALAQAYGQFIECLDFENPNEVRELGERKRTQQEDELLEKVSDEASLKKLMGQRPNDVRVRLLYAQALVTRGNYQKAIDVCAEIGERFGKIRDTDIRVHVAQALALVVACRWQLRLYEQALSAVEELIQEFGEAREVALREVVAQALVSKGVVLGQLERRQEALSTYEEVVGRFGEAPEVALREQVANALFNKGVVLGQLERRQEELNTYEEVVRRFGEAREVALREWVANALFNKGAMLGQLERRQEALSTYEEVVRQFGEAREVALREQVAKALFNKGAMLGQLERRQE